MLHRLKRVEWASDTKERIISSLPQDLQTYITNELLMAKIDWRYWANRYCRIVSDEGRSAPLLLWKSQEKFLELIASEELRAWENFMKRPDIRELEAKIRALLLKSRQVGGTVLCEALGAHLTFFFKYTRSIIASDHPDNSLKLYRVFTTIYDNLPPWMKPEIDSRVKAGNLHFPGLESDVVVGAGNQKTTLGQGMTIDFAHLTEMSTWDGENADQVDEDLKPAFASSRKHHSLFLIESTGQGGKGNWFHDQFQAARRGRSQFKALFVGWFLCPDKWAKSAEGVTLSETTQSLGRRIEEENNLSLTKEQLAWYQIEREDYEERGKLQEFLQEYPSFSEEAFQMGVKSVFPLEVRNKISAGLKQPIDVFEVLWSKRKLKRLNLDEWLVDADPDKAKGKLLIWEYAKPGHTYVVGVDVSYGIDGGDNSAIEVVRVGNRWQTDEQVAEWSASVPPADLDILAWIVGNVYMDKVDGLPAKMAIETSPGSPGIVCQTRLMDRGYRNFYIFRRPDAVTGGWKKDYGWQTTTGTRVGLVETGVEALKKGHLKVNSPDFVQEMGTFVVNMTPAGGRKVEHAPGYHDDRIFALFIAYQVAQESPQAVLAEERARNWELLEAGKEEKPRNKQFQEMGLTWEQACAKWEEQLGN